MKKLSKAKKRKLLAYLNKNKESLKSAAIKALKKSSKRRKERKTLYPFGFEYKK